MKIKHATSTILISLSLLLSLLLPQKVEFAELHQKDYFDRRMVVNRVYNSRCNLARGLHGIDGVFRYGMLVNVPKL